MNSLEHKLDSLNKWFGKELIILWIFNLLLAPALLILSLYGKLPLRFSDFIFLAVVVLLLCLYKPRLAFFSFVSLLALDNIILASNHLPIQIRPFQFVGGLLILSVVILIASGRLQFPIPKPTRLDLMILALIPLGFLATLAAPDKALVFKQNLILLSFGALYYLIRIFIRDFRDVIKSVLFFFASFLTVIGFGFYQAIQDRLGNRSFEIMFGRPNSTFTEPDWLGVYLCFALAVLLAGINFLRSTAAEPKNINHFAALIAAYVLLFLNLTLTLLTLSRSAWVGSAVVIGFFLLINLYEKKVGDKVLLTPRLFLRETFLIILLGSLSVLSLHLLQLSKFDVLDRFRSTTTKEQKITIACNSGEKIPQSVSMVDELQKFNCQFINLEEIEPLRKEGKFITEIYRTDPNIATRGSIYDKTWEIIKESPILGVGYGSIFGILGSDENGHGFNESNILLQVWMGSGILGLICFIGALALIFIPAFRKLSPFCPLGRWLGCPVPMNPHDRSISIITVLGILALIIPNLFNAGLFMGIFWLGLALFVSAKNLHFLGKVNKVE